MAIIEVGAAVFSTLKSLHDLIRDAKRSNDITVVKSILAEMTDRLLEAQEAVALLHEENRTLKAAQVKRDKFQEQIENYDLTSTAGGAFVYVKKDSGDGQKPRPNFCPHCFGKEYLSILQPTSGGLQSCPECKNAFQVGPEPMPSIHVF